MKTVILCGGLGTRLSEETVNKPKPLVKIGKHPIVWHIINIYKHYGFKDFILATGFKEKMFKKYFQKNRIKGCNIKLVNTGLKTKTGGRLLALKKYLIGQENFMLTYGDGLSNINLRKLLKFHYANKKKVTVTAVRPPARFGALEIRGNTVIDFREKSNLDVGWINGGYFVMEPDFIKYIRSDKTVLEESPLESVAAQKQLKAFQHEGFWQCMDTKRDLDLLRKQWKKRSRKWLKD